MCICYISACDRVTNKCFYVLNLYFLGCCEDNGEGLGADETLCKEVYTDACQHSGRCAENPDPKVKRRDGAGHEGCYKSYDHHE